MAFVTDAAHWQCDRDAAASSTVTSTTDVPDGWLTGLGLAAPGTASRFTTTCARPARRWPCRQRSRRPRTETASERAAEQLVGPDHGPPSEPAKSSRSTSTTHRSRARSTVSRCGRLRRRCPRRASRSTASTAAGSTRGTGCRHRGRGPDGPPERPELLSSSSSPPLSPRIACFVL